MPLYYEILKTNLGLAYFRGDHIDFIDHKFKLTKKNIKQKKIFFFKTTIFLNNVNNSKKNEPIKISVNSKVIQWLEPNYILNFFIKCAIFLGAFLLSFFTFGLQYIWACLLYAFFNLWLVSEFFDWIQKPIKKNFFISSCFFAALSLPLLLYLPFSFIFLDNIRQCIYRLFVYWFFIS